MVNNVFNISFNPQIIIMLVTSDFRIVCITINSRITFNKVTITVYEMNHELHQRNLWTDHQTLTNDHNSTIAKLLSK